MKKNLLFLYPLISIVLLLGIEQGLTASYITKTIAKVLLFLGIPLILFYKNGFSFLHFRKVDRQSSSASIIGGIAIVTIIVISFIKLRTFIDIDALILSLAEIGVTASTFPFVAAYILFGNSLLEEFFFRGLLPSFFNRLWYRILIPSLLFAIYHITIFLTWFSLPLLALAVFGLWIGGIIFQLVNEKSRTILPSWTIHMFADIGVLLVGIYMFYIY